MKSTELTLRVFLPFQRFIQVKGITRMVVDTLQGYMGFLPQRLDCVVALVPGILTYETQVEGEKHMAVDEGILIKTASTISISVHHAVSGVDLAHLQDTVEREFMAVDEQERNIRTTLSKLESHFIHQFQEFKNG